jgi:menaquinone-dependent protoporphyrinogen oxidase
MKTLIVYSSKYGCAEKCAKLVSDKLTDKADLCNLTKTKIADISQYDRVIIGGSIYVGRIQKTVSEFCASNLNVLKNKKVGLFVCCMRDGSEAETQLNMAFPAELSNTAAAKDVLGGEIIFSRMNFMDKLIVKKVAKIDKDWANISDEKISKFAQAMNN